MKLRKFSEREKIILNITIGIAVAVTVLHLVINPIFNFMKTTNKEIERKTFLLEKYFHVVKRGENVFSLYESHKYALEEKKDSQEVISELFERVEIIATESGVTIRRVKPRSVEDKEKYKEAILDIELEGQFSSLFRFINNLEASPYFIRILSFNLLPRLRSSQQLRCRLSLSKIFF
ncbi:MAG: type 4a pilus biogenesis protein PilO [Omnitrophica bacterium]|nr:type 4a pilus biogenesis protein PilO [Candidatus Omnitrophota bacterium]